jgi:hypothetical protein
VATRAAGLGRMQNVLCGWLPRCKGICDGLAFWSGAVLCSACSRHHRPLALIVSADEVPFCFAGFDALDVSRVVGADRYLTLTAAAPGPSHRPLSFETGGNKWTLAYRPKADGADGSRSD